MQPCQLAELRCKALLRCQQLLMQQREALNQASLSACSMPCRFAFATDCAVVVAFCGESAAHRLSWNAAHPLSISQHGGLGGVDDTLFSLLMSRPQVWTLGCKLRALSAALSCLQQLLAGMALSI